MNKERKYQAQNLSSTSKFKIFQKNIKASNSNKDLLPERKTNKMQDDS